MNYLINLYNQVGAGPRNISLNLISELRKVLSAQNKYYLLVPDFEDYKDLVSEPGLALIKLPRHESLWMKMLYRVYLDFVLVPQLVKKSNIDGVLAFGNFLIAPLKARKTVLLHHPYIFDDLQLSRLPFFARWIEKVKRFVFWMTLRNVDQVVVQSEYVGKKLKQKWPGYLGAIHIIENPVSNRLGVNTDKEVEEFIAARKSSIQNEITLLYVSRLYPHKNHHFLIPLSQALQSHGLRHRILITIDPLIPGARTLLDDVTAIGLPIINLGEIEQATLKQYYASAHVLLFPSRSETFGNPLLEAMSFGLPVVAPNLEYAHAVLGEVGQYYGENNADDCMARILSLINDADRYETVSLQAREHFFKFPYADEWLQKYLALI